MLLLLRSSTEVSFRVSSLKRTKSGAFRARKAIPVALRAAYQATYGQSWEVIFSAPASTPVQQAKASHAKWLAEVELRISALRNAKAGKGRHLTQREADALAGEWYREFTSQHRDNSGSPKRWSSLRETLWDRAALAGDPETGEADFDDPEVLSGIEIEARTNQFLTDRGIALTQAGRTSFLSAVVGQFLAATEILERRARGDWGTDKHEAELAPYQPLATNGANGSSTSPQLRHAATGTTAVALFEAYCQAKPLKPSTISRWKHVFPALDAAGWQGLDWDAQKWADGLIGPGRAASGVRKNWIAAPRAVWRWAQRKRLVSNNPFVGVTVEVPRKPETRETGRAFTNDEAATILRCALSYPATPRTKSGSINFPEAVQRWVPWLAAYTGARGGELTQLRVQDIEQRACGHVLRITPEAGPVKTNKVRVVPIHPHLVEMGLLEYVEAVRAGASENRATVTLFHAGNDTGRGRGPAVYARDKLAKWVRSLSSRCPSLADKGVQPNHGWRHTFRTRAFRAGIEKRMRDEICGHSSGTVADGYEHPSVEDMAEALRKFPRWEVACPVSEAELGREGRGEAGGAGRRVPGGANN
jgi:integrase